MLNLAREYPRTLESLFEHIVRWQWLDKNPKPSTRTQVVRRVTRQRTGPIAHIDANTDFLLSLAQIERTQWTR